MGTPYCTLAQLKSFGANEKQLASVPPEDVDQALAGASATINSYIGRVFNLPLTSFGIELTQAAAQIAAWTVLSVRGFNPGTTQGELLHTRYKAAMSWLKDIAEGRAKPAWPDTKQPVANGANPAIAVAVLAPSQGGIGLSGGSYLSKNEDETGLPVGTPGRPRQRGW